MLHSEKVKRSKWYSINRTRTEINFRTGSDFLNMICTKIRAYYATSHLYFSTL